MRWRTVWVDVLLLAVLTGCPRNHMLGIEDIDELEECIQECGS